MNTEDKKPEGEETTTTVETTGDVKVEAGDKPAEGDAKAEDGDQPAEDATA